MAAAVAYKFSDDESAKRFVTICAKSGNGFALFRSGDTVRVIDPTGMYAREIFRIARECGGNPA